METWKLHHGHGIVEVATGAGKTVLALAAAESLRSSILPPLRVRIIVPTIALAAQWKQALHTFLNIPFRQIGGCGGNQPDDTEKLYTIYIVNSARNTLSRHILSDLKNGFRVFLIADECHHYSSPENRRIFYFFPMLTQDERKNYSSLGLSATPVSPNHPESIILTEALGAIIYRYGFSRAISDEVVSNCAIFQIALSLFSEERTEYNQLSSRITFLFKKLSAEEPTVRNAIKHEKSVIPILHRLAAEDNEAALTLLAALLQRKRLLDSADSRYLCAADLLTRIFSFDSQAKALVFSEQITDVERLYSMLPEALQIRAALYHSSINSHTRKRRLEAFRRGDLRILLSCRALDEGLDVPDANIGIVLSCSAVSRQRIQRLGRLLRIKTGKELPCLYYLYINDTAEDSCFLSAEELCSASAVLNLRYLAAERLFIHPFYDRYAEAFLHTYRTKYNPEPAQKELAEVKKCLEEGTIFPHWCSLTPEDCRTQLRKASNNHKRNYWFCMQKLAEENKKLNFDIG